MDVLVCLTEFDFTHAVEQIVKTWESRGESDGNENFLSWYKKVERRPEKYKGDTELGYFRVNHLRATDRQETRQFSSENLKSGDTLSCWLEPDSPESLWSSHCFASDTTADFIEACSKGELLYGTVKCLGQIKVYETVADFGDEERGVSYPAAWLIVDAKKA